MNIELRGVPIVFFEEGERIIAHCVPLDVSSCGHDMEEARRHVREAIELFLETCDDIGTLNEVLEESGFVRDGENWIPPAVLQVDSLDIAPQTT
jgi:predicted RNase H-like HicB family nuclease